MEGIEGEFAGAQLGDTRLNKRLVELARIFEKKHGHSIAFSCSDWKTTKSAYRFFDNDGFSEGDIIAPHIQATEARVNSLGKMVLVAHDTTELNYTHHNQTAGLGYLQSVHTSTMEQKIISYGFLMHASLALTTDGVPLGIIAQKQWIRDPKNLRRYRNAGKNFTRVAIKEKESYK